jgi:putative mRNA 3-end processing factor
MNESIVDVTREGAILLGPDVVCDGFYFGPKVRVQTHVHIDHMKDFDSSLQFQKILATHPTYDLLKLIRGIDFPSRKNVISYNYEKEFNIGESSIKLVPSGHMVGSAQVQVILPDGSTAGYSSDFRYPLEKVIKVDTLVIDSNCGSIEDIESYSEYETIEKFLELIIDSIRKGPIQLTAHRGTIHRALDILSYELDIPIIAADQLVQESQIYRKYGYIVPEIIPYGSDDYKEVIKSNNYILIRSHYRQNPSISNQKSTFINLRRHHNKKNPIIKTEKNSYAVAFSDHSNLEETIAYVKQTSATKVITDNCLRQGDRRRPIELAFILEDELGIDARASNNEISNEKCNDWR